MKKNQIIALTLLLVFVSAGIFFLFFNKHQNPSGVGNITAPDGPRGMSNSIVGEFPHDTASYTEGLLFYKGELYESTGNYGFSKLRQVDLASGKAKKEVVLDKKYFGEGIAVLHDTLYQLTYKEKTVFVYTIKDLKKIKELPLSLDEGWALTTDGTYLIATDGGSDLFYFEPSTFKQVKKITVTESGSPAHDLNELEFINGFLYANQYQQPYILKIDPADGKIVAKADLTPVWDRIKTLNPGADVPNGIAYNDITKKIYVTGKWWPEIYEIQFSE
jgi:glutaminyl-peptide cyclotransferase